MDSNIIDTGPVSGAQTPLENIGEMLTTGLSYLVQFSTEHLFALLAICLWIRFGTMVLMGKTSMIVLALAAGSTLLGVMLGQFDVFANLFSKIF